MAQFQRLDQRQSQSLVITPQLRQAIELLRLNNQELRDFVEEELERNPLLSRAREEGGADAPSAREAPTDGDPDRRSNLSLDTDDGLSRATGDLDAPGEDVFEPGSASDGAEAGSGQNSAASGGLDGGPSADTDWSRTGAGGGFDGEDRAFDAGLATELSLRDHLRDQLRLSGLSAADSLIANRLIDETDEHGYLRESCADVAEVLGADAANVEAVLDVCQGFEPTGVMARSLGECLALQLRERKRLDPAMEAMTRELEAVARHDIPRLMKVCGQARDDIEAMIAELRALTPRPGSAFAGEAAGAVSPDVFVRELPSGLYAVELNAATLPRVLVDRAYYAEVSALKLRDTERAFISECAGTASWLVKSLDQRARTILKVASEIVRQQDGFFAHGVAHLRPLNLKTVADRIGMHESTVSRVTSGKYMATPRGLFELKYFFSAAIPSTGRGEAHSAEAVRHRIKALIAEEDSGNVLSDDQIVVALTGYGIEIARRTVAKYRESLGIPSSVKRRRMLKAG